MNERFLELAKQAGLYDEKTPEEVPGFTACFEKFAELIVRECMKVAVFKDDGYISTADVAGYMAAGRSTAAKMNKEHFGVEE